MSKEELCKIFRKPIAQDNLQASLACWTQMLKRNEGWLETFFLQYCRSKLSSQLQSIYFPRDKKPEQHALNYRILETGFTALFIIQSPSGKSSLQLLKNPLPLIVSRW